MKTENKKSMGTTIMIAITSLAVAVLVIVSAVLVIRMKSMQKTLTEYTAKMGEEAERISSTSMEDEVTSRLLQTAKGKAEIVDSNFGHFRSSVELLASDATYLYEHPDEFGRLEVPEPKAENDGKLVVHLTHSESTDVSDPRVADEIGLLGNEQNTLLSSHAGNPSMAKCYIATESGLMIEADKSSSDKINEDGSVAFYEPSKRPWYYETKEAGQTHFTNVIPEASGKRIGMMCGSPVTKNGKFMGVACAGMYLDDVDNMVQATDLGENGIACIINNQGQLLFSSDSSGILTVTRETADFDLRESENKDLAGIVSDALEGQESYRTINKKKKKYYAAFAHMETVGWAFVMLLPENTVMASTEAQLEGLSNISEENMAITSASFSWASNKYRISSGRWMSAFSGMIMRSRSGSAMAVKGLSLNSPRYSCSSL